MDTYLANSEPSGLGAEFWARCCKQNQCGSPEYVSTSTVLHFASRSFTFSPAREGGASLPASNEMVGCHWLRCVTITRPAWVTILSADRDRYFPVELLIFGKARRTFRRSVGCRS
jgi:hypothetical protein